MLWAKHCLTTLSRLTSVGQLKREPGNTAARGRPLGIVNHHVMCSRALFKCSIQLITCTRKHLEDDVESMLLRYICCSAIVCALETVHPPTCMELHGQRATSCGSNTLWQWSFSDLCCIQLLFVFCFESFYHMLTNLAPNQPDIAHGHMLFPLSASGVFRFTDAFGSAGRGRDLQGSRLHRTVGKDVGMSCHPSPVSFPSYSGRRIKPVFLSEEGRRNAKHV